MSDSHEYVGARVDDNSGAIGSPQQLNLACGAGGVGINVVGGALHVDPSSSGSGARNNGNSNSPKIKPKRLWKQFAGDTLTSARMHSVSVSERTLTVEIDGSSRDESGGSSRSILVNPATLATASQSTQQLQLNSGSNSTNLTDTILATPPQTTSATTNNHVKTVHFSTPLDDENGPASLKRIDTWASIGSIGSFEDYIPEGGSLGAAVFGIVKGTVGPAILYLPRGFQVSGYAVAIPAMIMATFMYIYNAYRLLACWRAEHDREVEVFRQIFQQQQQEKLQQQQTEEGQTHAQQHAHQQQHASSSSLPQPLQLTLHQPPVVMLTYPELAKRAFGPRYSILVDIGIASLQYGVCLTYLIFVPHNLDVCAEALLGITIPKEYYLALVLLIEIPLSWIRDIRKLTPTNVIATGLIAYGLFFVLVMALVQGMAPTEDYNAPYSRVFQENLANLPAATDAWFLFVGTSFFMMEGSITLLVPLQESIIRQQDRAKFPYTNQVVTTGIVVFYVFFSIVCCGAFGDSIQTALTASLDGVLATTIQLAYSIAVILTFPLQAFPAMEVLKNNLLGVAAPKTCAPVTVEGDVPLLFFQRDGFQRKALSTIVICLLGVVAIYAIDYLGNVVSIIGSLFGIPLALVVPPLMHNILVPDSNKTTRLMNNAVVGIGFLAMGAASFATIMKWEQGAEEVR